ncbi:MAG TPA: protein kinase [Candidatus Eisenbacteria bacterium]
MKTARALHPQDQIAHYRIVSPLAAGGMGEVYLAQDQTLERNVALKILPPELTRSEDRVRRFIREAKSASSLNHPNIVTIYEIGQEEVRPAEGAPPADAESSSVHYISMELVSGETLGAKIHQEKSDLRTLLGYLAQAAEGLAKAHAAGIVHRDLKPSNIMVSKDGFTKILDFGLAKLTERGIAEGDATSGATQAEEGTRAGVVLGTVGYMSPEQVQGKAVDHRSDIFSFGTILYEAVTRSKAFAADSDVETMHKILHDKPLPVEDLNASAPAEVRRLIRRCLAKNPEQRLQSAKDLALELREIVDEYDSLSPSGSSATPASAAVAARSSRRSAVLIGGAVLIAAIAIAVAVWGLRRGGNGSNAGFQRMQISTLTSVGDVRDAALSPDGRYLAFVTGPFGHRSVKVRQVATGSDVDIVSDRSDEPRGLRFSNDGDYLYFLGRDPDSPNYSALFQVPSLGGSPTKRLFDVDTRVSFAPDGKRVCFVRGLPQAQTTVLVVADIESGRERIVTRTQGEDVMLTEAPSWSPDGGRIAVIQLRKTRSGRSLPQVAICRVKDGRLEAPPAVPWPVAQDVAWLPDGSGLVIGGLDLTGTPVAQVGILDMPGGRWHRITNDLNQYATLSVASDGNTIAAIQNQRTVNIWAANPTADYDARPLTSATTSENAVQVFSPGDDGTIFFTATRGQRPVVFALAPAGGEPRAITPSKGFATNLRTAGKSIFFVRFDEPDLVARLYCADLDGGNARPLAETGGPATFGPSPDGSAVVFTRLDKPGEIWTVQCRGGEARYFAKGEGIGLGYSPDGSDVAVSDLREVDGRLRTVYTIVPRDGGAPVASVMTPPGGLSPRWSPDGHGVTFVQIGRDSSALYRIGIEASAPALLFRWAHGGILGYEFSPDGKRVALVCLDRGRPNVWVADAAGRNARQVTDFKTGAIPDVTWTRDGKRILFTYGESSSDVVLIKDFR